MTMSFARRQLLEKLSSGYQEFSPKYPPLKWAIQQRYAAEAPSPAGKNKYGITQAGAAALGEATRTPAERAALRAIKRLDGGKILCRQFQPIAGGFDYFTEPDHRPFPPDSAAWLIENGRLEPQQDGLFEGMSQTFRVPAHA